MNDGHGLELVEQARVLAAAGALMVIAAGRGGAERLARGLPLARGHHDPAARFDALDLSVALQVERALESGRPAEAFHLLTGRAGLSRRWARALLREASPTGDDPQK